MTILTILLTTITNGYQISGHVYEDVNGDSNITNDGVGIVGASVYLYLDNGDGILDSGDILITSTQTDSNGSYTFTPATAGDYFVIVDSKTLTPTAGLNSGFTTSDVWADQTYGSVGVYCDTDANSSTAPVPLDSNGSCYGGAYGDRSDNFSTLLPSGAEHYGLVQISDTTPSGTLDFGFSFNVVTNTEDLIGTTGEPAQGSLRQFILNANAILGDNRMRFVPAVPPTNSDSAGSWWQVAIDQAYDPTNNYALPPITDSNTTIDGTAYSYTDGVTIRDTDPGTAGHSGEVVGVGPDGRPSTGDEYKLPNFEKKELEVNLSQQGDGFVVEGADSTIQNLAIFNAQNSTGSTLIKIEANGVSVSSNFIGTRANGTKPTQITSYIGVDLYPSYQNCQIYGNLVYYLASTGVLMEGEGKTEGNDISQVGSGNPCGNGISTKITNGADTARPASSVVIDGNWIEKSSGFGVDTDPAGSFTLQNSTIYDNGVGDANGNLCNSEPNGGVRVEGSSNILEYNQIYQNGGAGVAVVKGNSTSLNNLISRNVIYENKGLGIDLDNSGDNGDGVTPNDGQVDSTQQNDGLDYPIITYAEKEGDVLRVKGFVGTYSNHLSQILRVEFYRAYDDGDNNGPVEVGDGTSVPHGEGDYFLAECNTTSTGDFDCNLTLNGAPFSDDTNITAIAIDSNSNTSEFGPNQKVVIVPTIYGFIFDDQNHNQLMETGEPGLAGISIKLWYLSSSGWVLESNGTTDSRGYFSFHPQNTGTYRVIEDAQNLDSPSAGSDLVGWISTTGNLYETPWEKSREILLFYGDYHGSKVTGQVFEDSGDGSSTSTDANDAVRESEEAGLERVEVKGCADTSCNTVFDSTLTGLDGNYSIYIPYTYNGTQVYIVERDLADFTSTGDNRNGVIDSDATASLADRNRLAITPQSGNIYPGYNFADVGRLSIAYPQGGSTSQGGTLTLRNTINIKTPGKVALLLSSSLGIPYSVWEDTDCDGVGDTELTPDTNGYYWLNGGNDLGAGSYCVVVKGFTPSQIEPNSVEKLTVLGFEDWKNAPNPDGETGSNFDDIGEVVDSYIISAGGSKLQLIKEVRNVSTGESFGVKNSAKPGDILEYRLTFKNLGARPVQKLVLHDAVPSSMELVTASYNGKDVKLVIGNQEFDGSISDSPDTDGVTFSNGVLNVDISKLTGGEYTQLPPGAVGQLYYRTLLKK